MQSIFYFVVFARRVLSHNSVLDKSKVTLVLNKLMIFFS